MREARSLYRKYRPQRFESLLGQTGAVELLQRALGENRISHAYLFSGPRGCGKTSMARILAKSLNCQELQKGPEPCDRCSSCTSICQGDNLDVVEIDAASNRGIDEIRELKDQVALAPYGEKWKIYIIDEVHMLTEHAFNALLKTLEEPPGYALFILATTEPHKVPVTIRSRCQHIPFHRISGEVMVAHLEEVARQEGVTASKEALWEIARHGDGALRDALSLLEQALVLEDKNLTLQGVQRLLGGTGRKELENLISMARQDPPKSYEAVQELLHRGGSVVRLLEELFRILGDLWVAARWGEGALRSLDLSGEECRFLLEEGASWEKERLWKGMEFISQWLPRLRWGVKGELLLPMLWEILQGRNVQESTETETAVIPRTAMAHPAQGREKRELPQTIREKTKVSSEALPTPQQVPPAEEPQEKVPLQKSEASEPPEKGTETSRARQPSTVQPPDVSVFPGKGLKERLLNRLLPETPWLAAALVETDFQEASGEILVDFPVSRGRHCYILGSTSPGKDIILQCLYEEVPELWKTLLRRGEEERDLVAPQDSLSSEEPVEIPPPLSSKTPETSADRDKRKVAVLERETPQNQGKAPEGSSDESFLSTLLSCAGGEILLEKREGMESPPEGGEDLFDEPHE